MPSTALCQKTEKAISSRGRRKVSFGKYQGTVISELVAQAQKRGGEDAAWWLLWVCDQENNRSQRSFR
jgi:hypothetical protein